MAAAKLSTGSFVEYSMKVIWPISGAARGPG
jgi:hypothetical protein